MGEGPISNAERTILLVEPSGHPRDQLASVLRDWGFHVIVAGDRHAGLAYLDALPRPALVIIGARALGDAPEDFATRIRRRADASGFELVLWAEGDSVMLAPPAPMRAVLPRPFELTELEAVVMAWRAQVAR